MQKDDYSKMLTVAAMFNNAEGAREALANGADPNGHQTALVLSVAKAYFHEASRNMIFNMPPLMVAAFNGHLRMIDLLIEAGADIDRIDEFSGLNALHSACSRGHRGMVKALTDRGADVMLRDRDGKTARALASTRAIRMMIDTEIQRVNAERQRAKFEASLPCVAPVGAVARRRL